MLFSPAAIAVALLTCLSVFPVPSTASTTLSSSTPLSTAGYFRLRWSADNNTESSFELQQSNNQHFQSSVVIYKGLDSATVLSGLANQTYYYRVRQLDQETWSNTVKIEVEHHSLERATLFFSLGLVMFLILIVVLFKATRSNAS